MTVAGLRLSRRANAVAAAARRDLARDVAATSSGAARSSRSPTASTRRPGRTRASATPRRSPDELWTRTRRSSASCSPRWRARTGVRLDPDVLTIGFARRAASYKRSDLDLPRPEPLEPPAARAPRSSSSSPARRIPTTTRAGASSASWSRWRARYPRVASSSCPTTTWRSAALLTRGADVWLNNPIRPLEACGTSGMKAAMNGVLNLLDPRRLVAGGLRARRERLGDRRRARAACRSRTRATPTRSARRARARGAPGVRRPRALGRHDAGEHRDVAGALLVGPHVREYFERLYAR